MQKSVRHYDSVGGHSIGGLDRPQNYRFPGFSASKWNQDDGELPYLLVEAGLAGNAPDDLVGGAQQIDTAMCECAGEYLLMLQTLAGRDTGYNAINTGGSVDQFGRLVLKAGGSGGKRIDRQDGSVAA